MGSYIKGKKKSRSVFDALDEAEEDHYADCPNADFLVRSAAFLLDLIFLTLLISGVDRLFQPLLAAFASEKETQAVILVHSLRLAIQATLFYLYLFGATMKLGASPAKLLLNLRVVEIQTGRKLTLYRVLLREVVGKIVSLLCLGIGFLTPLIRKDRLALHDLISQTAVKKSPESK